ncbi:unnamed protein product [Rotaria magnacalcarata]|uniref:RRM domain-containing protein n=2 Tax=Rotaria magnacalcarata TaxID=392030 RepID=A0A814WMC9_9BILA|nr:unnamed protein product [Rotaria magnacalcarata]CAF1278103.1 unnamed protein product [Rotaria magnacalcarata]CAF1916479.1 unnamed protein product [Rotaria magnacalcarata]CAF2011558.1 unnamed protein product [Rotaria magnacalcarata]CAF2097735.1 unnamed protein product [Rotaria magnacalcarata]
MSVEEKQARSVFVGNIPHGTTEDQMKEIFSVIGPILSFRAVCNRETGSSKGYGFAEYSDADTAQSAIRNLNGFEFGGRALRVDKASSQADELRLLQQQVPINLPKLETIQRANITPDKIPEVIARTIANLPSEQVVDLMKQMQSIIKEYPAEARTILIHNPQLTYSLLQSLVIMGLIPPNEATNMLHKRSDVPSIHLFNNPPSTSLPMVPPASFYAQVASMNFPPATMQQPQAMPNLMNHSGMSNTDQEKAQILMQILQLNDTQIAQLPADQRMSITMLREQIQKSGMISL